MSMVRRGVILLAGLGIGVAMLAFASVPPPPVVPGTEAITVIARPVPLNSADPAQARLGALTYRGGVALESDFAGFGGLSGLRWLAGEGRLVAVSDKGRWLVMTPAETPDGRLTGVGEVIAGPLLDEMGQRVGGGLNDAESLEIVGNAHGTPDLLVSFEQQHRVWRYPGAGATDAVMALVRPARPRGDLLADWPETLPGNGGIEAMAVAADGGVSVLIAEDSGTGRYTWQGPDGPRAVTFRYRGRPDFKPTDAVFLPGSDSRLLLLSRRYSPLTGVAAGLELVDLAPLRATGAGGRSDMAISGRLLAELAPPVSVDNMEALAVRPAPVAGQLWLYLLSDDNFSPLQRTLLLKFALTLPR